MSDFVNWNFLAKELNGFSKKARNEVVNPADRQYLDQMTNGLQESQNAQENSEENPGVSRDVLVNRNVEVDENGNDQIQYIEVENINGKIKKINPNDYEVVISGKDGKVILTGSLLRIGSGIYGQIVQSHGVKEAVRCLIIDLKKNPEILSQSQLSLVQARMIASSLISTVGRIPEKSLDDIMLRLNSYDKKQMRTWLNDKQNKNS